MESIAADEKQPTDDIQLRLEYEIEEDVEGELEEFVRLNHSGRMTDARNLFDDCLHDYVDWFPVAAEYADCLLREGDFAELANFCKTRVATFPDPYEKALLGVLGSIGDCVPRNAREYLWDTTKYTWLSLSLESFDSTMGSTKLSTKISHQIHLLEVITQIEAYTGKAVISADKNLITAQTRRTKWVLSLLRSNHFWEAQRQLHGLIHHPITESSSQMLLDIFILKASKEGLQHEPIQVAVGLLLQQYLRILTPSELGPFNPIDWNDEVTEAIFGITSKSTSPPSPCLVAFRQQLQQRLGRSTLMPSWLDTSMRSPEGFQDHTWKRRSGAEAYSLPSSQPMIETYDLDGRFEPHPQIQQKFGLTTQHQTETSITQPETSLPLVHSSTMDEIYHHLTNSNFLDLPNTQMQSSSS